MDVVKNENGSHSPAFDESWEPIEQLRWHAEAVALATGLRIKVTDHGGIPGERVDRLVYGTVRFNLTVRGMRSLTCNGPMHFADAWSFLDGVKAGAMAAAEGRD
ncbi:hypothetical protein I5Q34_07315 [Streptomyces sp. AV19]|uniref:hypothetical protein n=1 Tax=Streptomyces sp. AV19 TaxID=2793068 RepID=UPI0018FF0D4C|nr:hypothetical protein [Streptomyces sp. AV19]MBH1934104.1 hypothetical protein [Streptomyces sp. AV19]MDG4537174.1 hypothetical protein [Streptomyces sp. AV19]